MLPSFINIPLISSFLLTLSIPLIYLLNLLTIAQFPHTVSLPLTIILISLIISFVGMTLWALSYFHLGKSFGVLPKKQKRIKAGLYKYLNHPMYLGIFLTFIGLSLANQSLPGLLFTLLITTPMLIIRAHLESKSLSP